MKKSIAVGLALLVLLAALSGCAEKKTVDTGDMGSTAEQAAAPEPTAEPTAEPTPELTPEPTPEPTPTPDPTAALFKLGNEELEIRIGEITLEDGDLTVPVEGVTLKNAWRNLKMDVVIDGERYYLDTSHVTNDEYTRSTMRYIEKMPEQVLLYTEETADTPLVYDVSGGIFVG